LSLHTNEGRAKNRAKGAATKSTNDARWFWPRKRCAELMIQHNMKLKGAKAKTTKEWAAMGYHTSKRTFTDNVPQRKPRK
jgi:hypothetical protein